MKSASVEIINAEGLRALCDTLATLPDLCHHAEYRIYVDGQYVESAGSKGSYAQHVRAFWQLRRRKQNVDARTIRCTLPNCERRQL
jgi:hypothetical protein